MEENEWEEKNYNGKTYDFQKYPFGLWPDSVCGMQWKDARVNIRGAGTAEFIGAGRPGKYAGTIRRAELAGAVGDRGRSGK